MLFEKHGRAFLPVGGAVVEPTSDELADAVAALDPALADEVQRRFPRLPALLDFEGELALVVLDELDDDRLRRGALPVGLTVANDLTARSVLILGEGVPDPLPYWAASKSFSGFPADRPGRPAPARRHRRRRRRPLARRRAADERQR